MITDAVLSALFGGINALLSLMPSWTLPTPESSTTGLRVLGSAQHIVPLDVAVTVLTLVLALKLALTYWDFLVFVYHQFWGSD